MSAPSIGHLHPKITDIQNGGRRPLWPEGSLGWAENICHERLQRKQKTLLINFKSTVPRFHGLINANLLYQRHLSSACRNLCMSPAKGSIAGNISQCPPFFSILNSPSLTFSLLFCLHHAQPLLFFPLKCPWDWSVCGEGGALLDNLLVHFAHLFPIMCNITSVIR